MKVLAKLTFLSLFLCFGFSMKEESLSVSPSDVLQKIKSLHQQNALKTASLGVSVVDQATGKVIVDYNGIQSLATASTMKAITTATGLAILGEDFEFKTQIGYEGTIDGGVLKGNLFIRGSGDPTLGDKELGGLSMDELLAQWAKKLKEEKGIQKIEGAVIADASIFDNLLAPRTWSWEDMGNYYGAGAGGIILNQNLYRLYFKPSSVGRTAKVLRTEPPIPEIEFINEMKTGAVGSGDNGYIFGTHFSNIKYLNGSIPAGVSEFSIKGSIPDPAYFAAVTFQEALIKAGIQVSGSPTSLRRLNQKPNLSKRFSLFTHSSPPLKEIIKPTNFKSINLNTEAILKMIAVQKGKEGSTEAGCKAVNDFWKTKGVDMKGFNMEDGSGLSRYNAVTPNQMSQILQKMNAMAEFESFYNSLPILGQSGTVRNMGRGTTAAGRIRAKSGTIKRVRCYTGYAEATSGKKYTFSIFINNYPESYRSLTNPIIEIMNQIVRL